MTLPQKLGKYEIRSELGRGAMGVVYEGWDAGIARRVAIKTVKRDQLDRVEADETLTRFQREAQAAGRLSHPNIVSIFEYGEEADGTVFIAMEFIEGRELRSYFDNNERFALPEIGRIMGELLGALGHAHANGIVHRDIKPANLILLKQGTLKVADFGIARIESSNLTQAGSVLGTPAYMSPEQFMGQTVDGRSDLFSAGVILYQFLTGDKPFSGTLTTIMHKVLKEEPLAPSELNVQVPRPFDALVRKALAKRPEDRFQTALEFSSAIAVALQNKAPVDPDATLIGSTEATIAPMRQPPSTSLPPAQGAVAEAKPRSKTPIYALAGLAVLALVAGGALLMTRGEDSPVATANVAASPPVAATPAPALPEKSPVGTLSITAVGYADPSDPRYADDKGLMQADLREDARRQLVEKAAALYIEPASLLQNYGLIQNKLLANSSSFITAMQEDQTPRQGKDGLVSMTTHATVNVRQVQKSLNQMSTEERVEFIRNNGDPKISVTIAAKSAQADSDPNAPAQRSPVAENLLKERIQSFGFRMMNDDQGDNADFAVAGEAKFKRIAIKLEASGITVEKFVLTSWTVKCTDKKSSEEIYYSTQIPEKQSWATEEQALRDVGNLIADEFSKNFFLKHFHFVGQKVVLKVHGLDNKDLAQLLLREFTGLRPVLDIKLASTAGSETRYDAELSGGLSDPAELVAKGMVAPLNQKFGKTCLNVTGKNGNEVSLAFESSCGTPETLGKFDALPDAALITAPQLRRENVIRNPETRKKISS